MGHLGDLMTPAEDGSLTFANFVEFWTVFTGTGADVSAIAVRLNVR